MARKPDPKSKAGFVRSFASSIPAAEIVTKAKAKGLKIDVRYVYSVRTASRAKTKTTVGAAPVLKRGPGRPRKSATNGHAPSGGVSLATGGLVAEIERIVEAKVSALLKSRLGAMFG